MPTISVIIPTYNRAHLLSDAINSILGQTFQDFELLIVDDASQDDTADLVSEYDDERIRYIRHETNHGAAWAQNTGIKSATGKFFAILADDDLALPSRLEDQLKAFQRYSDAGLIFGRFYRQGASHSGKELLGSLKRPLLKDLLLFPVIPIQTAMIKRDWLVQSGGFDTTLRVAEDRDLIIRLFLDGCQMYPIPEPVTLVRYHKHGLTNQIAGYEADIFRVIDKAFSHPDFPDSHRYLHTQAVALDSIRLAVANYVQTDIWNGNRLLDKALSLDCDTDNLVAFIATFVPGYVIDNPESVISLIDESFPGNLSLSKDAFRRLLWSRYYAFKAFEAYRNGSSSKCRNNVIKAFRSNRELVWRDRGLTSIFLRSLTGATQAVESN